MGGWEDWLGGGRVGEWMGVPAVGVCGARLIREALPLVWARAGIGSSSCQGRV